MFLEILNIIFGWRKASKCKKVINRVRCRLKQLKNKRVSIVRQLREDIGQLLRSGDEQIAFNRVEQLVKDDSIMAAYGLLDGFCEFVVLNLSYIRRNRDCPNGINEAVSSLIFASARVGNLPELQALRKLFVQRYGRRFGSAALELLPGNLVNSELKEKLKFTRTVPHALKNQLMGDVRREYFHKSFVPLALEYKQQKKQGELALHTAAASLFPDETEEAEELPSCVRHDATLNDQRIFVFKSVIVPRIRESEKEHDSASSRTPKPAEKGGRKDVEFELYYGDRRPRHRRKHQRWITVELERGRCKELIHGGGEKMYLGTSDDMDPWKTCLHAKWLHSDHQKEDGVSEVGRVGESKGARPKRLPRPPYVRAAKNLMNLDSFPRTEPSNHGSSSSPCHVHPKLPDYDELEAKFIALKKAYLENAPPAQELPAMP